MKASTIKRASGKPQGQKTAPWAARGGKRSGSPQGQTGAPWAARGGRSTGKPQGQKSAPVAKKGGKATTHVRSKAKLGGSSKAAVTRSVRKSKGY